MAFRVEVYSIQRRNRFSSFALEYQKRIQGFKLEMASLSSSQSNDPMRARKEETESLLKKANQLQGACLVAMNPEGKMNSSEEFSKWLFETMSLQPVVFLIGGAYGLERSLLQKKHTKSLSLSSWTLPHELCHLVLLEQLYRADSIKRAHPYHHALS